MAEPVRFSRQSSVVLALMMLAGCAATPVQPPEASSECRALFQLTDAATDKNKVRDYGPVQVPGFPYLRVNRLLASYRDEVDTDARFTAWIRHMAALDAQARRFELSNLTMPVDGMDDQSASRKLDGCREHLIATELGAPKMRQQLREAVQVPDAYAAWTPLVSARIDEWHKETRQTFATPLNQLPVAGELIRWVVPRSTPLEVATVKSLLTRKVDPLGLPVLSPEETQQLFDTFAPAWEVDAVNDEDRIGMPYWSRKNVLAVNVGQPIVYKLVSHTRFNGMVLLQLNYIVWFPSRSGDDIYTGPFDGITWRVTLGPDGTPWLFDAMHNCGCYYQVFPTAHMKLRNGSSAYSETPLQPQAAPEGRPLVIRIAHATHHIQRIYRADRHNMPSLLSWRDYDTLRAMPALNSTRSMFGENGIVEASTGSQRFLLWPTGVRSPGSTRQWGQHAIGLAGHRHFDDAHLLDDLFEPARP